MSTLNYEFVGEYCRGCLNRDFTEWFSLCTLCVNTHHERYVPRISNQFHSKSIKHMQHYD